MEYKVSLHVEKRLRDTQRDKLCEVRDMDCSGAKGSSSHQKKLRKGPWLGQDLDLGLLASTSVRKKFLLSYATQLVALFVAATGN